MKSLCRSIKASNPLMSGVPKMGIVERVKTGMNAAWH